jgi:hypothetical protein
MRAKKFGQPSLRIDVVQSVVWISVAMTGARSIPRSEPGEKPALASHGNLAVILPISGRMLWSSIGGIHCKGRGFVVFRESAGHRVS